MKWRRYLVQIVCVAGLGPPATQASGQTLTNWALAGIACQSSTLDNSANPVASKAIDNNTDGITGDGSVAHTGAMGSNEWWEVDLGAARPISNIHVWLETDCCFAFQDNLNILVYDSTNAATRSVLWQTSVVRQIGQPRDFDFDVLPPVTGRTVRVEHPPGIYANLALAEVQVFNLSAAGLPAVVGSYIATGSLARMFVTFSGSLDSAAATNPANYVFGDGVTFSNLVLQPDQATVALTLADVIPGQIISLAVSGVSNVSGMMMSPTNLFAIVPSLSAPQDLSAVPAATQVALSWSPAFGSGGYWIERDDIPMARLAGTSLIDTNVLPGMTYCYAVAATNTTGVSAFGTVACATVPWQGRLLAWDPYPSIAGAQDGSGIWNGGQTNWWSGTNEVVWSDNSVALLGADPATNCTVTLATEVTPAGITFNPAAGGAYVLAGSGGINCSNLLIIANADAVIGAVFKGSGSLVKAGNQTVTLTSQSASFTGVVLVNGGTLMAEYDNNADGTLPDSSGLVVNNGGTLVSGNNGLFGWNAHAVPVTLNSGGTLTTDTGASVNIYGLLTLAGGTLASGGPHAVYGSYNVAGNIFASDNSSISAQDIQFRTDSGQQTITVAGGETLNVTGYFGDFGHSVATPLTKSGAGTVVLAGVNTFTGPTVIGGGSLLVNGSLTAGSAVMVNGGGTLGGTGMVAGTVTVNGGLAPGSGPGSVGILSTGQETWGGGGTYVCEICSTNVGGSDQVNINGGLNIGSVPANRFTIKLVSLAADNTPGLLTNFNKFAGHTWTIVSSSSGILNFSTENLTLDTSGFANDISGGGFGVLTNGNSLLLQYTAAPLISPWVGQARVTVGQGVQLTGLGGAGQAYVLLGATNLSPAAWIPIITNVAGSNGEIQFDDPQATNYRQRFYRLSTP